MRSDASSLEAELSFVSVVALRQTHATAAGSKTMQMWPGFDAFQEYWQDAWQRSILFLDVLRERGNIYLEHSAKEVPHVLSFKVELVRDGRTLARPVNYVLVRIIPTEGMKIDPTKAPVVVVDPRAGHGP